MLTHDELCKLLTDHYTSEELCDILEISPDEILLGYEIRHKIKKKHDELVAMIQEDTGYGLASDED